MVGAAIRQRHQVQDGSRQVQRPGRRAELVVHHGQRLALGQPVGGGRDLVREVVAGRAVQPRRARDPEPRFVAEGFARGQLPGQLAGTVGVARRGLVGLPVALAVSAVAGEDLVGGDHQQAHTAGVAGSRQDAGSLAVAAQGELGLARALVDQRHGRGVDDQRWPVALEQRLHAPGAVQVMLGDVPADERLGADSLQSAAQSAPGAGDCDGTHVSRWPALIIPWLVLGVRRVHGIVGVLGRHDAGLQQRLDGARVDQ